MANPGRFLWCGALMGVLLAIGFPAWADQGKELFDKHCASCHTVGGGDSGGPDLKGVAARRPAEWMVRMIVEPDKLTAGKDPVQTELVKKYGFEMPNLGISPESAKAIVAYLSEGARAGAAPAATPPGAEVPKTAEIVATPELVARGKALFTGARRFDKGGAPCGACHTFSYPGIQSGNLAADLTGLYAKMGEQGVRGVLKSLKFPIMKRVYADRPLTDEEMNALIAFIKDAAENKGSGSAAFPLAGAGLFVCFIVGLTLYKRRIG